MLGAQNCHFPTYACCLFNIHFIGGFPWYLMLIMQLLHLANGYEKDNFMPIVIIFCSLKQDAQWESVTGRKVEKLLFLPKAVERHWIKKLEVVAEEGKAHTFLLTDSQDCYNPEIIDKNYWEYAVITRPAH